MIDPTYRTLGQLRFTRRTFTAAALSGAAAVAIGLPRLTLADGDFQAPKQVGKGYDTYGSGPAVTYYNDSVYAYANGADSYPYYSSYSGGEWTDWSQIGGATGDYAYRPAAITYNDYQYVFSYGDGKIYGNEYDGASWSGWTDHSGPYSYSAAPYVNSYGDAISLYAPSADGNLYHKGYNGTEWTTWEAISDDYAAGPYQVYALDWDGVNNVIYTGQDGKVYWNRYGGEWSGTRELPGTGEYGYSPYAAPYGGELYVHTATTQGVPSYNVFTGESWTEWQAYPTAPPVEIAYQPAIAVYEDAQHMIYTGQDGKGYYTTYDGGWAGEWTDLGPSYAHDPASYEYGGDLYLIYTREDGKVYTKTYAEKRSGY